MTPLSDAHGPPHCKYGALYTYPISLRLSLNFLSWLVKLPNFVLLLKLEAFGRHSLLVAVICLQLRDWDETSLGVAHKSSAFSRVFTSTILFMQ